MKKLCASVAIAVVGSGAFAGSPEPVIVEAPVVAPLFSWVGGYVGAHAGYLDSDIDLSGQNLSNLNTMSSSDLNASGAVGGVFAGYNWQPSSNLVYGVEAEINATGADKSGAGVPPPSFGFIGGGIKSEIDWSAALRGRVGYAVDRTLLYVAGGVAFADVSLDGTNRGGNPGPFSYSETLTGWTIGAGVEHAFTDNWVARLDYRYSDYGDDSFSFVSGGGTPHRFELDAVTHEVKVGIAYKF